MGLRLAKIFIFLLAGFFYSQQKQQPMKDCFYYANTDSIIVRPYYNPSHSLIISSKNPKVFSLSEGIVSKIFTNDNSYTIIVRSKNLFYIYSNLASIHKSIKVDKYISRKRWLGNGSLLENAYSIELQIYDKTNILPDIKKYIKCEEATH